MIGRMRRLLTKKILPILFIAVVALKPTPSKADFWGGDIPLLIQIVANTLQQLAQLRAILGNGQDTLGFLRDINQGISEALNIMRTMNSTLQPGIFSQYRDPATLLSALQDLYGLIPETSHSRLEAAQDQSVSEAITLHNQAFDYAAQIDPEAERIKDYSHSASPAGAGRLTAESLGVLIHVSNQILRTNAALLKIQSENLALQNRKEKMNSAQFHDEYRELSKGFNQYPSLQASSQLRP
jgi:hypothetical protein